MTITAWRIVKARHARSAFNGEGARLFGGRWNNKGTPMVYAAGSQSLAVLEMLVHLEAAELLGHYVLIPVTFDHRLARTLAARSLPAGWRRSPAPAATRRIGDRWVNAAQSAVLQVPSVLVPGESNYLINIVHPDFRKISIGRAQAYAVDPRLA